ncbi:Rpa49 subunit specific to nuclear RNA polymerase I [Artomyces pyxidatus]|uniref:Rpa49 subunit specific to nuclear RNA polymerase I n=1 Tax=Artomyces pyxidatus TaxID=48021 RepID=A0ACB8T3D4_9AGAM|nr:Rpa49 subunit specific to nuclear RNA polymerase I [Artomyces pyxidatus]
MATSSSSQKKRKRAPSDAEDVEKLSLELSDRPSSQLGPVLASFPSLQPSKHTAFKCYVQDGDEDKDFVQQRTTIVGETDAVEFSGSNEGEGTGSKYFLALHRRGSGKVILQPAPLYILAREVKSLKNHQPTVPTPSERIQARNVLGETFGTKKAKTAIRAAERNKVDVSAMEGAAGALQDRIEEGTANLPTQEEAKSAADAARLIPPYVADAETPEDAYPLHNIVPEQEWNALDGLIHKLKGASSDLERVQMLPNVRSTWVKQHLSQAFRRDAKASARVVKLIICVATMLAFRNSAHKSVPDRATLLERLLVPEVVVDGLLARFTETARGSTKAQMTSEKDTSILTHIFALCLKVDDFASDTTLIASDLKKSVIQVNTLFRSLGCKIDKLTPHELTRLGLPASAAETKRAVLKVPLVFPKPRAKRRT